MQFTVCDDTERRHYKQQTEGSTHLEAVNLDKCKHVLFANKNQYCNVLLQGFQCFLSNDLHSLRSFLSMLRISLFWLPLSAATTSSGGGGRGGGREEDWGSGGAAAPGFGAVGGGCWNFGEVALLLRRGKRISPGGGCK